MNGRKDGDKIVFRSTAADASLNFNTDSIVVTISDTTMPKMTLVCDEAEQAGPARSGAVTRWTSR